MPPRSSYKDKVLASATDLLTLLVLTEQYPNKMFIVQRQFNGRLPIWTHGRCTNEYRAGFAEAMNEGETVYVCETVFESAVCDYCGRGFIRGA